VVRISPERVRGHLPQLEPAHRADREHVERGREHERHERGRARARAAEHEREDRGADGEQRRGDGGQLRRLAEGRRGEEGVRGEGGAREEVEREEEQGRGGGEDAGAPDEGDDDPGGEVGERVGDVPGAAGG
jgi:hypothetical protein